MAALTTLHKIPPPKSNTVKTSLFFAIFFTIIFVNLINKLIKCELGTFDTTFTSWVQSSINPELTKLMKIITSLGSPRTILTGVAILGIIMIFKKQKWKTMFLILFVGIGGLINLLLKWIFKRQRPTTYRLIEEMGYSFPSGHSMVSLIFYGMLVCLFVSNEDGLLKITSSLLIFSLVMLIGISRIYLGVHYPSDVLAGFTAGGILLTIGFTIYKVFMKMKKRNNIPKSIAGIFIKIVTLFNPFHLISNRYS